MERLALGAIIACGIVLWAILAFKVGPAVACWIATGKACL